MAVAVWVSLFVTPQMRKTEAWQGFQADRVSDTKDEVVSAEFPPSWSGSGTEGLHQPACCLMPELVVFRLTQTWEMIYVRAVNVRVSGHS
jgi:hypothetical protein